MTRLALVLLARLALVLLAAACMWFTPVPAQAIGLVTGSSVPHTCMGYPKTLTGSPSGTPGCSTLPEVCDYRKQFYPPATNGVISTRSGYEDPQGCEYNYPNPSCSGGCRVAGEHIGAPSSQPDGDETTCPANATASGASCICNAGFRPPDQTTVGTTCAAHTCGPPKGLGASAYHDLTAPSPKGQLYLCDDARGNLNNNPQYGCGITATRDMSATGADGKITEWWNQSTNTTVCNGNGTGATPDEAKKESDQPDPAPTPCAKGTCPGTISGTPTCQACSSTTGSGTTTTGTGSGAPGTTTTKDISCTGSTCVTTETTKDAAGNVTSVTQSTSSKTATCAVNGGNPVCGGGGSGGEGEDEDPSTFGGSCAGGFTCEGDAVQCAIARDQHIRHCTMFDLVTAEVTAGLGYINESSAEKYQPDGHPGKTPTEVNIGTMFSGSMVSNPWGSSCPGDQVIAGITLPLSQACGSLQLLGSIAVALTILMCAGWLVTRGV